MSEAISMECTMHISSTKRSSVMNYFCVNDKRVIEIKRVRNNMLFRLCGWDLFNFSLFFVILIIFPKMQFYNKCHVYIPRWGKLNYQEVTSKGLYKLLLNLFIKCTKLNKILSNRRMASSNFVSLCIRIRTVYYYYFQFEY